MLRVTAIILLCFSFLAGHAQWQVGFSTGIANYEGDLTDKVYVGALTRPMAALHLKYELSQRIILRGSATRARVAGHDQYISKPYLRARNLSFETNITEASGVVEIHSFRMDGKRWSPYVFGGLALFHYNPFAFDSMNKKYLLKTLRTEGQGIPGYPNAEQYGTIQWAVPFGGGLRYSITPKVILGAEFGLRRLFTDYLDDVSTNYAAAEDLAQYVGQTAVSMAYRGDELPGGNPAYPEKGTQRGGRVQKDYYYFTSFSLSFRLGQSGRFGSDSKRSGYGCPGKF